MEKRISKINLQGAKKVHFIGIGGISMSGLSEVLKRDGYVISGSDDRSSEITEHLTSLGIEVAIPNAAENITDDIDLAVYTAAIKPENPEFSEAKKRKIPMMERAELLGEILKGYQHSICVAGTHGKTTTTSLVVEVTLAAGLDPTISIGGHMGMDGSNYRVGNSSCFVLEACEYSNSFHHWHPHVGIILNIDADHLDFFGDMNGIVKSFRKFAENIRKGGVLVIQSGCGDEFIDSLGCDVVTFGMTKDSDIWASNIEYDSLGRPSFDVMDNADKLLARVNLTLPGEYNMLNALACFAAAKWMGVSPSVIANALGNAKGVKRRFEHKGVYNGAEIIDDYAHHPTEIEACLTAAKKSGRRVICLFQPHTYTRTKNHLHEFALSFHAADLVMLLPIFAAREPFDPSISSADITKMLKAQGINAEDVNSFDDAVKHIRKIILPGDLLITMGAGDVYKVGESLLST